MTLHRDGISFGRIFLSSGILFAGAVLVYTDCGIALKMCLLAATIHELGHLTMCFILRVPVKQLRLTLVGAVLELGGRCAEGIEEWLVALAGPASNLLTAFLVLSWDKLGEKRLFFVGASVLLAVFNLLPVRPLDGSRALHGVLTMLCPQRAEWLTERLSMGVCAVLLLPAVFFALQGNPSLFVLAVWMLCQQYHPKMKKQ